MTVNFERFLQFSSETGKLQNIQDLKRQNEKSSMDENSVLHFH